MFDGSEETNIILQNTLLTGITSVSFDYQVEEEAVLLLANRGINRKINKAGAASCSISKAYIGKDIFPEFTGYVDLSGQFIYGTGGLDFNGAAINSYKISLDPQDIPKLSVDLKIYGDLKPSTAPGLPSASGDYTGENITPTDVVFNLDDTVSAVTKFSYSVDFDCRPTYEIETIKSSTSKILTPIKYAVSADIEMLEQEFENMTGLLQDENFDRDISFSFLDESGSVLNTFSVPNASLKSQKISITPTDTIQLSVDYVGYGLTLPNGVLAQFEPTYNLTSDKPYLKEGGSFTITLNTTNIDGGPDSIVPYTILNIQAEDISESLTGNFIIKNNTASVTFNLLDDGIPETLETFILTLDNGKDNISVSVDDIIPTDYLLTSNITNIDEGSSFIVTLNTLNTNDGTVVPYTITGVQPEDINESLTGSFTINNNVATATFTTTEDFTTEGLEAFVLTLDVFDNSISIDINDTSIETYTLSSNASEIDETNLAPGAVTITLSTQGVPDGTLTPYTIAGIQSADINESLTGNFITNNNIATIAFTGEEDITTEGPETLTLTLDNRSENISVLINDTSTDPTLSLFSSHTSRGESEFFTITLNSSPVPNGTIVPYTITGIQAGDIQEPLTGNFVLNSNSDTAIFNLVPDITTEGPETFTLTLNNSLSISVIINDTSVTPVFTFYGPSKISEGSSFTVLLESSSVPDGTTVSYTITGIQPGDIGESLTGSFTMNSNSGQKVFNVLADSLTEGIETFALTLDDYPYSKSVDIIHRLSILTLGTQTNMFPGENAEVNESYEVYSYADYNSNPTGFDSKVNSGDYDVIVINNLTFNNAINLTTYNALKSFVMGGGTLIDWGDHISSPNYVYSSGSYIGAGVASNMAYDFGGITTATNSGWKDKTTTLASSASTSQIAVNSNIVLSTSILNIGYAQEINNTVSNGIPIVDGISGGFADGSIVHMWDGSIAGHLNSNVDGRIIIFGDSGLTSQGSPNGSNGQTAFYGAVVIPLLEYIVSFY
jgi:hypothetical protein